MQDNLPHTEQTTRNGSTPSIRLIADLPTKDDVFGAHDLLADAIADTILCESGGKAIALEGGWGCGKSSVVEMLREKLSSSANKAVDIDAKVLIFDAWSHEGDPLRRVFLEHLTNFCCPSFDEKQQKFWIEKKRKELTGRAREVDQTTTPLLHSGWSLAAAAFFAIYPITIALITGYSRQNLSDPANASFLLLFVWTALLLPLALLGLFIYVQWWPFWPFSLRKKYQFLNDAEASIEAQRVKKKNAGRVLAIFAKKIDETSTTSAHETQGPTSIEFQKYFAELMKSYLQCNKRKLVIVLDNLDRVPSESAKTLWTALRVFAECCEDPRNSEWSGNVWFLVPYDPVSAKRVWDADEEGSDYKKKDTKQNEPSEGDKKDLISSPLPSRLSAAFLDKTFQVRFDVPPLLLSDWKQYLSTQLITSLGEGFATPEEIHRTYLLSRRMSELKRRPPTPRHLKLFSNDIAALCRRFKMSFPLSHFALYAILRRQGHDVRLWLLEEFEDQERYQRILGDDEFKSSLCAMAHGILDKERARDLHLIDPIKNALANGDHDSIKNLVDVNGFWQVLEVLCDGGLDEYGTNEELVTNTLKAIEDVELLSFSNQETNSLRRFLNGLVGSTEWELLNSENAEGFISAIRLGLDDSALKKSVARLSNVGKDVEASNFEPIEWLEGLSMIAEALKQRGRLERLSKSITIESGSVVSDLLSRIGQLAKNERFLCATLLELKGELPSFISTITPVVATKWEERSYHSFLAVLAIAPKSINAKEMSVAICGRISSDEEQTASEIDQLVSALEELCTINAAVTTVELKKLAKSGFLYRRIKNLEGRTNSQTFATLLRWLILYGDLNKSPSSPIGAAEGFEQIKLIGDMPAECEIVVSEFASRCNGVEKEILLDSLLVQASNLPSFVTLVVKSLIESGSLGEVLTGELFCKRFVQLEQLCSAETLPSFDEVTDQLMDSGFVGSLSNLEISPEFASAVGFLVALDACTKNREFETKVKAFLYERTIDEWKNALTTGSSLATLTIEFKRKFQTFELGRNLADAIESLLTEILEGKLSRGDVSDSWKGLVDIVPATHQQSLAGTVIARSDKPDKLLIEAIPLLSEQLAEAVSNYNGDSFVRNALNPLVKSGSESAFVWLEKVTERQFRFWDVAPESDKVTFADYLSQHIVSENENIRNAVASIASRLEIDVTIEPTEPEENSKTDK